MTARPLPASRWRMLTALTEQGWREDAACAAHPHLPWTPEVRPSYGEAAAMTQVCADCPVWRDCAEHALSVKETGGFWAGVWIPWPISRSADPARNRQRTLARTILRNRLAVTQLTGEDDRP